MRIITRQEKILLQEALDCGMLGLDVSDVVNDMKKTKVLNIHPYTITAPKTDKGRWQTFLKDEQGGRKKVSATTEKGLFDKLYYHYFEENAVTLESFYPEWIAKRYEQGISARTVRRNENHWEKYYRKHPIVQRPLHKLTAEEIENFFHEAIKKYGLTTKELGNMKLIFVDMLKLAKKRNLIKENPFLDVDIKTTACKPQKKQNDTSRVYLPEEREKVFRELQREIRERPNVTDMYAVYLLFKLGLRIGELVALKWEDIDTVNSEIHIHRMETLEANSSGKLCPLIAEYTKKKSPYGDRFLPYGDYERALFEKVKEINERCGYEHQGFIFCDENGRTNIRSIDNLIRKVCEHAGVEVKSAHDIRRTVASEMFNSGIPVEIIRNYLGHSDIKTTFSYILDNNGKQKTNNMILQALSKMNGLKGTQVS